MLASVGWRNTPRRGHASACSWQRTATPRLSAHQHAPRIQPVLTLLRKCAQAALSISQPVLERRATPTSPSLTFRSSRQGERPACGRSCAKTAAWRLRHSCHHLRVGFFGEVVC
ncbi:hypothetical protein ARMA_2751 [Ardenticatena maritima]|uniref:Uncharacterized protein n=1 Tax=Ardenticatena maritima TaxID=872965 RepID=A0A0M9UDR7_9CHLR|nr:hypothetical protein ARMA_2751 [Ardenticatena maritima]